MEALPNNEIISLIVRLLAAHLLADFYLQPTSWVLDKKKRNWASSGMLKHLLVIATISWIFSGFVTGIWLIPIAIFVLIHWLTDSWKSSRQETSFLFISDQLIHILTIILIVYIFKNNKIQTLFPLYSQFSDIHFWIIFSGFLLVAHPVSHLIYLFTRQFQKNLDNREEPGLANAGKTIGILERWLILIFILINQFNAVDFLIAAKSILRFADIRNAPDRKMAEYILIGTMMSFLFAIIIGITINYLYKFEY
jgi:hypothetical protein